MIILWTIEAIDIILHYFLPIAAILCVLCFTFKLRSELSVQKLLEELKSKDWRYDG